MLVRTPISLGELIDKITILEIKKQRINDHRKLANVIKELELLEDLWNSIEHTTVQSLADELKKVNEQLWDIETFKRNCERQSRFDNEFIEAARAVYKFNDRRAALKREINLLLGSEIVEEKSYS